MERLFTPQQARAIRELIELSIDTPQMFLGMSPEEMAKTRRMQKAHIRSKYGDREANLNEWYGACRRDNEAFRAALSPAEEASITNENAHSLCNALLQRAAEGNYVTLVTREGQPDKILAFTINKQQERRLRKHTRGQI